LVRRQSLTRALLASLVVAALAPAVAHSEDQKVAIGHYQWSNQDVQIQANQHVTWYWVGPDTMHSVTGMSANDMQFDSDPGNPEPNHPLGTSYQVTFNAPGVYYFQCKLHSIVHGNVTVAATPGNPADDPEPVPGLNVDLTPPTLNEVSLRPADFPLAGTTLYFTLDDAGQADAEIYRLGAHGQTAYAGYEQWPGHIGYNTVPFATRGAHFKPSAGRYRAMLKVTDAFNNVSSVVPVFFTILRPHKAKRRSVHHKR
jgi:plastocyanin